MTLIEAYEAEHHSIPDASPVEVLRTLMGANDLRQKDMVPIFGSESIVSEVLHKKRDLNKTHIKKLSKRFKDSPSAAVTCLAPRFNSLVNYCRRHRIPRNRRR